MKHPLSVLEDVLMEGCASTELAIVLIHTQDMPVLKKSVSQTVVASGLVMVGSAIVHMDFLEGHVKFLLVLNVMGTFAGTMASV